MRQYTYVIGTPNPYAVRTISLTVVAEDESAAQHRASVKLHERYGGSHALPVRAIKRTPAIVGKELESFELR
jgi:hypothetical protein